MKDFNLQGYLKNNRLLTESEYTKDDYDTLAKDKQKAYTVKFSGGNQDTYYLSDDGSTLVGLKGKSNPSADWETKTISVKKTDDGYIEATDKNLGVVEIEPAKSSKNPYTDPGSPLD